MTESDFGKINENGPFPRLGPQRRVWPSRGLQPPQPALLPPPGAAPLPGGTASSRPSHPNCRCLGLCEMTLNVIMRTSRANRRSAHVAATFPVNGNLLGINYKQLQTGKGRRKGKENRRVSASIEYGGHDDMMFDPGDPRLRCFGIR